MPKRLIDRLRPDSIWEFRAAAHLRFAEGELLATAGSRLAAVYMWGYAAEMALKASYFESILYGPRRPIQRVDLRAVVVRATVLGVSWPSRNLHDLACWREVLVAERRFRGSPFRPGRAAQLIRATQRLFRLWRETLRYRSNRAYSYEVRQVRQNVRTIMNLCDVS